MPNVKTKSKGVDYYALNKKKPVSTSTKATSDFLVMVAKANKNFTIKQLFYELTNRNKYIFNVEAVQVLLDYMSAGCSDYVPEWR